MQVAVPAGSVGDDLTTLLSATNGLRLESQRRCATPAEESSTLRTSAAGSYTEPALVRRRNRRRKGDVMAALLAHVMGMLHEFARH